MKDLTPKFDNTAGSTGQLTAPEFNDFADDVQNAIIESGQTLTTNVGENNRQLSMAIAAGGKKITRNTGQTALIGERVTPNNLAAACTIGLPTTGLFVGATVIFEPEIGQLYSVYSLTIDGGGNKIQNVLAGLVLNSITSDNAILACVWTGSSFGWKLKVIGIVGRP